MLISNYKELVEDLLLTVTSVESDLHQQRWHILLSPAIGVDQPSLS